jgi:RES domain-containing protein
MTSHPEFPHFFNVLKNNSAVFTSWKGDVFRQGLPRWMSLPYRFTGVGSVFAGGRWGVQGLMPAVYASADLMTLNAEAYFKARRYGWTTAQFLPQLVVDMRWEFQVVLDLTAAATRKALKVTKKEIMNCDWVAAQATGCEPVTQAIARAAFEHLAEGLVVPSARRAQGVNLVYFPSHRRDGTVIRTLHEADIPFMHGL